MATPAKLIAIGEETGVILPDDALARLGVGSSDTLYLSEAPDGSFLLTVFDPMTRDHVE